MSQPLPNLTSVQRTFSRASAKYERGHLQGRADALETVEELSICLQTMRTLLASDERLPKNIDKSQILAGIGAILHLTAEIEFSIGENGQAIDAYQAADDAYGQSGLQNEAYGRLLGDYAQSLSLLNVAPAAVLPIAKRAEAIFTSCGTRKLQAKSKRFVEHLEQRAAPSSDDTRTEATGSTSLNLARLRRSAAWSSGRRRAERMQQLIVALLSRDRVSEDAPEILQAMKRAFGALPRGADASDLLVLAGTTFELYWAGVSLPDWLGAELTAISHTCERDQRLDLLPDACVYLSAWHLSRGDIESGLRVALKSLATADEHFLTTSSSFMRFHKTRITDYGRILALSIAVKTGDSELAAELIESSRLQVLPDVGGAETFRHPSSIQVNSRVASYRPVSVGGRSRIGEHLTTITTTTGQQAPVEYAAAAVGGTGAQWWGAWMSSERLYWSARIAGEWSCGSLSLSGTDNARPLLEAMESSFQNPRLSTNDILRGAWCATAESELSLSLRLADILIPPSLLRLLRSADEPLSIVVSGNVFSAVPVAALAFREGTSVVRLVERAVIRISPPAVLVEVVSRRDATAASKLPVLAACVDSRGDLPNSRLLPIGAESALGTATEADLPPANRQNLEKVLRGIQKGRPGIFYYAGHVVSGGIVDGASDAFALAGDEVLTAQDIFESVQSIRPLQFPSKAIISACSSAGAGGSGAGEWLGLSAAMLMQGCDQVVASNWTLWDTAFTSRFDMALVEAIRSGRDAAAALRECQIHALREWEESSHDYSNFDKDDALPYSANAKAFPLIWAAYCCMGLSS